MNIQLPTIKQKIKTKNNVALTLRLTLKFPFFKRCKGVSGMYQKPYKKTALNVREAHGTIEYGRIAPKMYANKIPTQKKSRRVDPKRPRTLNIFLK